MQYSSPVGRRHFIGMDALRGVAAFVVAASHALEPLHLPQLGNFALAVDFFFVLSGFVVGYAYGQPLAAGRLSTLEFFRIRLVRLHPLLVAGIVIALLPRLEHALKVRDLGGLELLLVAAAAGIACVPWNRFSGDANAFALNGPQWSLVVEYVANIAFGLTGRWLTELRLVVVAAVGALCLVWLVATFGTLEVGWKLVEWPWIAPLRIIYPFAIGLLLARLQQRDGLPRFTIPWLVQAAILLAILMVPVSRFNGFVELAAALIVFPVLIVGGRGDDFGPKGDRIARWAGAISYPLYILHRPIVHTVARIAEHRTGPILWLIFLSEMVAVVLISHAAIYADIWIRDRLDPRRRRVKATETPSALG